MKFLFFIFLSTAVSMLQGQSSFLQEQLGYSRVQMAKMEKDKVIKSYFEAAGLPYKPQNLFLRTFKYEGKIEVWTQPDPSADYVLLKTYDVCEKSGWIGPKRRQGDMQVPEGFYYISEFKPTSNFYLSLKLNYPNPSDQLAGKEGDLGGNIYIHGECESVGCLPIENDKIKELYWLLVQARSNGQIYIPVHIFPYKFNESVLPDYWHIVDELQGFWNNIREGFDYFETYHRPPFVHVNENGTYAFF